MVNVKRKVKSVIYVSHLCVHENMLSFVRSHLVSHLFIYTGKICALESASSLNSCFVDYYLCDLW